MLMNGSCTPPQSLPLRFPLFFFCSSSLHLPPWSVRESAERDFSAPVMKLPQGDSKGKLGWLSSFLPARRYDGWKCLKRPDYFCRTVCLSGSQLAVRRECFGRWCKQGKAWRWPCWDVCGFVYSLYVHTSLYGVSEVWCEGEPNVTLLHSHDWLHSEPVLGFHSNNFQHCKKYVLEYSL